MKTRYGNNGGDEGRRPAKLGMYNGAPRNPTTMNRGAAFWELSQ